MTLRHRMSKTLQSARGSKPTAVQTEQSQELLLNREQKIAGKPFASACYAPTVSMYFDQFGNVRACCQNTGALMGNVTEQSIRQIWQSASTAKMRAALKVGDFSEGCGFCEWQVDQGDEEIVFARVFDDLAVTREDPIWPVQMEFSMTNSCNLQCEMCNGDWSSSIRAHREQRPPLPVVYHDSFFEELAEFLPHLHKANFLGGEPFLGKEPLRVMTMLAALPKPPEVAVTTNGTQWSDRIEDICERLPMSFVLSLDGITAATYESIRVGANFAQVMKNLDRFQAYAEHHGTKVTLAHCLMRSNFEEFAQLLRFAEDRNLGVGINEVLFPVELSLFQLPPDELSHVVATLEADSEGIAQSLQQLRPVFDGQLNALRHRLELLNGGQLTYIRPWATTAEQAESWEDSATRLLAEWANEELPTRIVITRSAAESSPAKVTLTGSQAAFLSRLGIAKLEEPEQILAVLRAELGGSPPLVDASSNLIHDVIIGDNAQHLTAAFRVAWSAAADRTVVYVSVLHPDSPENPAQVLAQWCGADRIITLSCDEAERINDASGALHTIGFDSPEQLIGRTTADVVAAWQQEFGSFQQSAGPSGFIADTLVSFSNDSVGSSLNLRVIVERHATAVLVFIGTLAPSGEVT
ncbi:MAG: radical SAM protein [Actinomycetes bacterium]